MSDERDWMYGYVQSMTEYRVKALLKAIIERTAENVGLSESLAKHFKKYLEKELKPLDRTKE